MLAAVLRASSLHGFTSLYNWAKGRLESMWPSDNIELSSDPSRSHNLFECLYLARTCSVPKILKRVLYEIVRMPRFNMFQDGLNFVGIESNSSSDGAGRRLSWQDTCILVSSREQLHQEWISAAASVPVHLTCPKTHATSHSEFESTGIDCHTLAKRRESWDKLVIASGILLQYSYDPICGLAVLANSVDEDLHDGRVGYDGLPGVKWESNGWCEGCVSLMRKYWMERRAELWKKLDEWFLLEETC